MVDAVADSLVETDQYILIAGDGFVDSMQLQVDTGRHGVRVHRTVGAAQLTEFPQRVCGPGRGSLDLAAPHGEIGQRSARHRTVNPEARYVALEPGLPLQDVEIGSVEPEHEPRPVESRIVQELRSGTGILQDLVQASPCVVQYPFHDGDLGQRILSRGTRPAAGPSPGDIQLAVDERDP